MFEAPLAIATLLEGVGAPWWIGGGWAIDLFLGRVTRAHQDVDVVILRRDQERFRRHLGPGWALVYVQRPGGGRVPWTAGQRLASPIHEIHATAPATGETLELLLNEADGSTWHYRRDARITLPLDRLGATSRAVIPASHRRSPSCTSRRTHDQRILPTCGRPCRRSTTRPSSGSMVPSAKRIP
jgi:hypothetical protein